MRKIHILLLGLFTAIILAFVVYQVAKNFYESDTKEDTEALNDNEDETESNEEINLETDDESTNVEQENEAQTDNDPVDTFSSEMMIQFEQGQDISNIEKKEFFEQYNATIIESNEEQHSYLVEINELTSQDEQEQILNDINETSIVEVAMWNQVAVENNSAELNQQDEMNQIFSLATSNYNDPTNVYYHPRKEFSLLYPYTWTLEIEGEQHKLSNYEGPEVVFIEKVDKQDVDEESVTIDFLPSEYQPEGDLDKYVREDGTIIYKWLISNGDAVFPRGLVVTDKNAYLFDANEYVTFDDFALVTDSFFEQL